MGKGQRSKAASTQTEGEVKNVKKPLKEWQIRERNKRRTKIVLTVIVVLAIAAVGILIGKSYYDDKKAESGDELREVTSLSTANYTVNNAMFTYFYRTNLLSELNTYGSVYQQYYGLDTTKSLKDQTYSETQTWYDHFIEEATNSVKTYLTTAEAAREAGTIDDAEVKSEVDKAIDSYKKSAESNDYSLEEFFKQYFGIGIKEQDVRDALSLAITAELYNTQLQDALDYSEADCEKYVGEHEDSYLFCDYISYSFGAELPEGTTTTTTAADSTDTTEPQLDADTQAAYDVAKAKAEALAQNKDVESFNAALTALYTAEQEKADSTSSDTTTEENTTSDKTPEEEIAENVEKCLSTNIAKSSSTKAAAWMFEDGRQLNDTTVIDEGDGKYTAVLAVTLSHRKTDLTKNVRHILFETTNYDSDDAAKARAEEVYDEWKSGDATEDSFSELAEKYSEDTGSIAKGGFYEDVTKGQMVEEFNDWVFDSSRQTGDNEIIKTSYGYHIMYFVGDGETEWIATAKSSLMSEQMESYTSDFKDKYQVTYDESKLPELA